MRPEIMAEMLELPLVAVIAASRRDGRPYQVPVWFLWDGQDFWLTGTHSRVWCRQLKAEPRCSLLIQQYEPVARYVAADCVAHLVTDGIWPMSERLARKYLLNRLGAQERDVEAFVANMKAEPRLLFRLEMQRFRAIDLTVYTGSRGDIAYRRDRQGD